MNEYMASDLVDSHKRSPYHHESTGYKWSNTSEIVGIWAFFIFMIIVLILTGQL